MAKKKIKHEVKANYAEYFIATSSPKLKNRIDVKALIEEEVQERTMFL